MLYAESSFIFVYSLSFCMKKIPSTEMWRWQINTETEANRQKLKTNFLKEKQIVVKVSVLPDKH